MRRRRDWPLLLLLIPTVSAYYENIPRGGGYDAVPIGPSNEPQNAPYLPPRAPVARGYQPPPQPALFEPPRSYYIQQHYQHHGHGHMPSLANSPPRPSTEWARPQRPLDEAAERQLLYEAERRLMTMRTQRRPQFNEDDFLMRAVGAQNAPEAPPTHQTARPALPQRHPDPPHRLIYTPEFAGPPAAAPPPRPAPSFSPRPAHTTEAPPPPPPPDAQFEVEPSSIDLSSLEKNPPDVVNNIIVHIFLNAKEPNQQPSHATAKIGPIHGVFGIGTAHGGPGTHQNPIVIVKDFDRDRLKFVDENTALRMVEEGPANIVEVKAMVSTPDKKIEHTLNRAVNNELDRAIPVVLNRFHGTMTMDTDLRKELEQALVDEIAKNLGETIDSMSGDDVTQEDIDKLIEEGFNEVDGSTTTVKPTTRRITVVTMTSLAPPTEAPETEAPPTSRKPTTMRRIETTMGGRKTQPTEAPPTEVEPSEGSTEAPPTEAPPTEAPPTQKPRTRKPTTLKWIDTTVGTRITRPTTAPPTEVEPAEGGKEAPPTEAPPTQRPRTRKPTTMRPIDTTVEARVTKPTEAPPTEGPTEAPPTEEPFEETTKKQMKTRPTMRPTEPTTQWTPPTQRRTQAPPTEAPPTRGPMGWTESQEIETEPTEMVTEEQSAEITEPAMPSWTKALPTQRVTEAPPTRKTRPPGRITEIPPRVTEAPPTPRITEAPPTRPPYVPPTPPRVIEGMPKVPPTSGEEIPETPPAWWVGENEAPHPKTEKPHTGAPPTEAPPTEAPPTEAGMPSRQPERPGELPPTQVVPEATPTTQTPPPRTFRIKTTSKPTTPSEPEIEETTAPPRHVTQPPRPAIVSTEPTEVKVPIDFHHENDVTTHAAPELPTRRPAPPSSGEEVHIATSKPVHVVDLSSHETSAEATPHTVSPGEATPPRVAPSEATPPRVTPTQPTPTAAPTKATPPSVPIFNEHNVFHHETTPTPPSTHTIETTVPPTRGTVKPPNVVHSMEEIEEEEEKEEQRFKGITKPPPHSFGEANMMKQTTKARVETQTEEPFKKSKEVFGESTGKMEEQMTRGPGGLDTQTPWRESTSSAEIQTTKTTMPWWLETTRSGETQTQPPREGTLRPETQTTRHPEEPFEKRKELFETQTQPSRESTGKVETQTPPQWREIKPGQETQTPPNEGVYPTAPQTTRHPDGSFEFEIQTTQPPRIYMPGLETQTHPPKEWPERPIQPGGQTKLPWWLQTKGTGTTQTPLWREGTVRPETQTSRHPEGGFTEETETTRQTRPTEPWWLETTRAGETRTQPPRESTPRPETQRPEEPFEKSRELFGEQPGSTSQPETQTPPPRESTGRVETQTPPHWREITPSTETETTRRPQTAKGGELQTQLPRESTERVETQTPPHWREITPSTETETTRRGETQTQPPREGTIRPETQTPEPFEKSKELFETQTPPPRESTGRVETQTPPQWREITPSTETQTQPPRERLPGAETQTTIEPFDKSKELFETPPPRESTGHVETQTTREMGREPFVTKDLFEVSTAQPPEGTITHAPKIVPSSHEIDETAPKGMCPTPNEPSDRRRADVLFLLDSSNKFTEDKFMHSITLILDTVERLKNIGPDGVQVSLVQFNTEPYLEFSLRKHDCKQFLKDDIADTQYMTGGSKLGRALDKVTKFAFTRKRGDRPDAENILVILTDGQSEDRVQLPVKVSKDEDVTVYVIGTLEANPAYLQNLAGNQDNVFRLNGTANRPLADQLAGRISQLGGSRETSAEEADHEEIMPHRKPIDMNDISAEESQPATVIPEHPTTGVVHLDCAAEGFKMKLNLPGKFVGHMVVKGYEKDPNCQIAIRPAETTRNRTLDFFVATDSCGVSKIVSEQPKGQNSSVVVQLVHAPQLRTGEDRAFLLQCFVGVPEHDDELSTRLDVIKSEVTVAETISLSSLPPSCTYSIRKERPDGPVITKATVGQTVYHRWDCDGDEKANDVYGIKVHSCFASDDVEQKYPIVDIRGCSSDLALLTNPVYDEDHLSAYALSHVFGVLEADSLKFVCKLSLCTRDGDGCEGVTPPMCSNNHTDLLVGKTATSPDEALTSALSTEVDIGKETSLTRVVTTVVDSKILLAVAAAVVFVVVAVFVMQRINERQPLSPSVSSRASSQFEGSASSSHESQSSGPVPDPRLVEFLKTFDRSNYV